MFVTATNFETPPYDLPSLADLANSFADFVTEQEEEQLGKLFGLRFWEAFKAGIAALPEDWVSTETYVLDEQVVYGSKIYKALDAISAGVIPGTDPLQWEEQAANKWLLLKVGGTYETEDDVLYKWVGMTELVKPMIYSLWAKFVINDQVSSIGGVQGKSENSNPYSVNIRICREWNKYFDLACGPYNAGNVWDTDVNSLYGYLVANSSDFDSEVSPAYDSFEDYLDSEFTSPGRQNVFDF